MKMYGIFLFCMENARGENKTTLKTKGRETIKTKTTWAFHCLDQRFATVGDLFSNRFQTLRKMIRLEANEKQ